MAYYYYSLWDHQKVTMRILTCALVVTYIPAFVLLVLTIVQYRGEPLCSAVLHSLRPRETEHTMYIAVMDACVVIQQANVTRGFWACLVLFLRLIGYRLVP